MYYEASHPLVVVAMHFMLGWLETFFLQKMKSDGMFLLLLQGAFVLLSFLYFFF